jgi:CheY-like chemotaxis protein
VNLPSPRPVQKPNTGRPTVLLVEDDFDTREALLELLTEAGYSVECAADGQEAVDYLQAHSRPAAVVCDLLMPLMDGKRLVEHLRRSDSLASIPVILMSGTIPDWSDPTVRFLPKPLQGDDLLKTLEELAPLWLDPARPK